MQLFGKRLTENDRQGLQQLQNIENTFVLAASIVKGNTALFKKGQDFAANLEQLAKLLSQHKNSRLGTILNRMGIAKATVNIYTGRINELPADEPVSGNNPKTESQ